MSWSRRVIVPIFWLLILAACAREPAEQQVRTAIDAAAHAVEAADAARFGEYISADFVGNGGDVAAAKLTGLLRLYRLRGDHINVLLGPVTIERRGERLQAAFNVTLGGGGGQLLPERLGVYQVDTSWRLENGTWRCYAATWDRAF